MQENKIKITVEAPNENPRTYEGYLATVLVTDSEHTTGEQHGEGATGTILVNHILSLIQARTTLGDMYPKESALAACEWLKTNYSSGGGQDANSASKTEEVR